MRTLIIDQLTSQILDRYDDVRNVSKFVEKFTDGLVTNTEHHSDKTLIACRQVNHQHHQPDNCNDDMSCPDSLVHDSGLRIHQQVVSKP